MVVKLLFSELLFQYAETCFVGVNLNLSENVARSHVCHAKSLGKKSFSDLCVTRRAKMLATHSDIPS